MHGRRAQLDTAAPADHPRGGIATALLALAQQLAGRDHTVRVFADVTAETELGGARFLRRDRFAAELDRTPADVLVCLPDLLPLLLPVRVRTRVVWSGNAFSTGDCLLSTRYEWAPELGNAGRTARLLPLAQFPDAADVFVAKSCWQARHQQRANGGYADQYTVIGNGVPLEYYRPPDPAPTPTVVYTSQARRGLPELLEMWPEIRRHVPDATLRIFGYDYRPDDRSPAAGVQAVGAVSKSVLADELRRAWLLAYPNTLRETFCTAVAEAQAAGVPVVTSARAALLDRVAHGRDGYLVQGEPHSRAYRTAFIDHAVAVLRDGQLRRRLSEAARSHALLAYDWGILATRWEQLLTSRLRPALSLPRRDIPIIAAADCELSDRGRTGRVPLEQARNALADAIRGYGFDDYRPTWA